MYDPSVLADVSPRGDYSTRSLAGDAVVHILNPPLTAMWRSKTTARSLRITRPFRTTADLSVCKLGSVRIPDHSGAIRKQPSSGFSVSEDRTSQADRSATFTICKIECTKPWSGNNVHHTKKLSVSVMFRCARDFSGSR